MNNTAPAPLDPASFDAHLQVAEAQVSGLCGELADVHAKLATAPGDDQLHALAAQLEREIATAQARHQRLLDARAEAGRRFTAAALREHVDQMQQRRDQVAAMGEQMFKTAVALHTALARLRPQLAGLATLGRQRAELAANLMVAESHVSVSGRETRQSAVNLADAGGAIALLLEAALREAGIGQPGGPTQYVTVPPPPRYGGEDPQVTHRWHAPDADTRALAQVEFKQSEANLLRMLDGAIAAARAKLPRVDTPAAADIA